MVVDTLAMLGFVNFADAHQEVLMHLGVDSMLSVTRSP